MKPTKKNINRKLFAIPFKSTQVGRRQLVEQQPLNDGLRFIGMVLKLISIMVFCMRDFIVGKV